MCNLMEVYAYNYLIWFNALADSVHVLWDTIDRERKLPYQKVHVCMYWGICFMPSLTLFTSYGTQVI